MFQYNTLLDEINALPAIEDNFAYAIYEANDIAALIIQQCKHKPLYICDNNMSQIGRSFYGYTVMSVDEAFQKYKSIKIYSASAFKHSEIRENIIQNYGKESVINYCSENIRLDNSVTSKYVEFFRDNEEKIDYLFNMFSDEQSKEVLSNLIKGFISKKSHYFADVSTQDQYFPDVLKLSEHEVFIDGGAYRGETVMEFMSKTKGKYKAIHSFEPTPKSYKILERIKKLYLNNDSRIKTYNVGLSDHNGKMNFLTFEEEMFYSDSANRVVSTETDTFINVMRLDDIVKDEVTYIKLDVEGSELLALRGAQNIIRKYKPKLAICLYHNVEDLYTIPKYISDLHLPYKYYLRHHGIEPNVNDEIVLYAI